MDKLLNKQDIIQFINQEKKKPNISDIHKKLNIYNPERDISFKKN